MKFTIIITLLIIGLAFFGVLTYTMGNVTASPTWTGMNNSDWEDGFMKVAIPFAILGFVAALVITLFKGNKPKNPFGGEE